MKKVILFGSISLATKVLKLIEEKDGLECIGVCCKELKSTWRNQFNNELVKNQTVYSYCKKNNIDILSHNEIIEMSDKVDIGFSVRYHKIMSEELINKFTEGIINVHGGILPYYRGTYANVHSIINNEDRFGVTLHYIDPGVDTGDIIDVESIKISEDHTGFDLYLESEKLAYELIKRNIDKIIRGNVNSKKQKDILNKNENQTEVKTYKSSEITKLKSINIENINTDEALRIIRAFDSPFHEPAYTFINDKKVYLRYKYNGYEDKNEKN